MGVGAGTKNFDNHPNIVRVMIGRMDTKSPVKNISFDAHLTHVTVAEPSECLNSDATGRLASSDDLVGAVFEDSERTVSDMTVNRSDFQRMVSDMTVNRSDFQRTVSDMTVNRSDFQRKVATEKVNARVGVDMGVSDISFGASAGTSADLSAQVGATECNGEGRDWVEERMVILQANLGTNIQIFVNKIHLHAY